MSWLSQPCHCRGARSGHSYYDGLRRVVRSLSFSHSAADVYEHNCTFALEHLHKYREHTAVNLPAQTTTKPTFLPSCLLACLFRCNSVCRGVFCRQAGTSSFTLRSCPVKQVWTIRVDVHVTAADGNVSDAVVLSALAALLAFRCPAVSLGGPDDRSADASDPLFSLCSTQVSCCHSPSQTCPVAKICLPASHRPWPLIMPKY